MRGVAGLDVKGDKVCTPTETRDYGARGDSDYVQYRLSAESE